MFNRLVKKQYRHLNRVLIDQAALAHNHHTLQEFHPEARIIPVLKSNAYGHGLQVVAPIFDSFRPPFLAVDSLFEAYTLHKLKLPTPILVLGYTHPSNYQVKRLPFHFTVFDLATVLSLNRLQQNCPVHIFVDTGMNREGIPLKNLPEFIQQIQHFTNVKVVGLVSHFADADNPETDSFTQHQIQNYKQALDILHQHGIDPQFRQISASAGTFKLHDSTFNLIRAGIASYGLNPLDRSDTAYEKLHLKPALSFVSTLAQIKTIAKGEKVGYNLTYTANQSMTIGLLPLGYYEGVDRRLSNAGTVTLGGSECPILGRVSMNMTVIDISKVKNPQVGDEVVIYSSDWTHQNSLVNAAQTANTIPYDILVKISESVKRVVV